MADKHTHLHHHDHHDHDHSDLFHTHAPAGKMKQAFFLALVILIAEVVFGLISNSLALLADAWHMLTDVAAIGLSWFALKQAEKPADKRMTFGYDRAGILAAAINGLTLIVITIWILYSAITRILHPENVGGLWMLIGAAIGLVMNLIILFALNGEAENLNVKAAFLHVIGDVGASAGVIIAGIVIYFTGWKMIDPILSVGIAFIVGFSAWSIIKQSFGILMEATPKHINLEEIAEKIKTVSGIQNVHDLHIWQISSGSNFLSCHAVVNEGIQLDEAYALIEEINSKLKQKGISHATIQLEDATFNHEDQLICTKSGEHHHDGHSHTHG